MRTFALLMAIVLISLGVCAEESPSAVDLDGDGCQDTSDHCVSRRGSQS